MNTPVMAGLFAIAVAVGGSAPMNDERTAARVADGTNTATNETAGVALHASAADADGQPVRQKSRCKNCGVVESVDRIERPDLVDGVCTASDDINIRGTDLAGGGDPSQGFSTLANMARRLAAAEAATQSAPTPLRYRIVVRLRNGTRHVFDEATSRTLRSGDLVHVI